MKGLPFDASELSILKPLIITLGLDVDNVDDFIGRVNYYFTTLEEFNKANVTANLAAIKDLVEKYHKFRVQLYNGKPKTLLPVSYKQVQSEPVSVPVNQQNVSPIIPSMPNINVPKPPATISPVPDANKFNPKRKRVPCVHYHSPMGCARGERCDFIHDPNYKGQPTPNMDKYVRPMNKLSRAPDMNMKNLNRYNTHYNPPSQGGYGGMGQSQNFVSHMQPHKYPMNNQNPNLAGIPRPPSYPMVPPPPGYHSKPFNGTGSFVPPPPSLPSYMRSNMDASSEANLAKRQNFDSHNYRNDRRP